MSTSSQPTVSVVIPLYNKVDYIERTLESVIGQDYQDFEIILVDDGSTDGSAEIVTKYSDRIGERFKHVRQERAGAGAARNRGMRLASGELVAFLDADDLWVPEKLGRQVRFMEDHPDIDWCSTNYLIAQRDRTVARTAMPPEDVTPGDAWIVVDWFSATAEGVIFFQTSGVLLRKSLIRRIGEFDVTIPSGQDFDYWVRIAETAPRCGYLRVPCYTWTLDSLYSISSNEPMKYRGKVDMLTRFMERSTHPDSPAAYQDVIRSVSEDVIRGSIAQGHPDVARTLLRSFPEHWRASFHAGYVLLTYVPGPILRSLALFRRRAFTLFRGRSKSI